MILEVSPKAVSAKSAELRLPSHRPSSVSGGRSELCYKTMQYAALFGRVAALQCAPNCASGVRCPFRYTPLRSRGLIYGPEKPLRSLKWTDYNKDTDCTKRVNFSKNSVFCSREVALMISNFDCSGSVGVSFTFLLRRSTIDA